MTAGESRALVEYSGGKTVAFCIGRRAIYSVPPELQDPPRSCKLRGSAPLSLSLSPALPPRPSRTPSLFPSHSAAAPSAPQLSRSTALSHIDRHALSARTHSHTYTHTRAHKHSLLRYPVRRSGFSNGIPSASSPGDGRCSTRVSESSERCSRVLLIGDAAGSPVLFLFTVQESPSVYTSTGDLKWTRRFDRDFTLL